MAIALFPICEGESIGSNLGRYADFIGLRSTSKLRRKIFGHACKPDTKLPSGILHLAEDTCDYWGLPHTEFNYATLTLSEPQKMQMFANMLSQPTGRCSRRSACGWLGERDSCLRYCDHCLSEWRRRGVCPYWILCHQLPGVYVCHFHSTFLKRARKPMSGDVTEPTLMMSRSNDDEKILMHTSMEHKVAIDDVASRSAGYMKGDNRLPSSTSFRSLLRDAGLVRSSGQTDHRGLMESMLKHFGVEYCLLSGLNWQKVAVWSRNISDLTRTCDPSHAFMFIAAESLLLRRSASPQSFVPSIRKDIYCRVKAQFSQREIEAFRARWHSIVQSARPDKRITSAYRVDSKLYRILSRHDHAWLMAYNQSNKTLPGPSSIVQGGTRISELCSEESKK
jgi:hypothetical protein